MFIVRVSLIEQGLVDDMEPEWLLIFFGFFLIFPKFISRWEKIAWKKLVSITLKNWQL